MENKRKNQIKQLIPESDIIGMGRGRKNGEVICSKHCSYYYRERGNVPWLSYMVASENKPYCIISP